MSNFDKPKVERELHGEELRRMNLVVNEVTDMFASKKQEAILPKGEHQGYMAMKGTFDSREKGVISKTLVREAAMEMFRETNNVPDTVDLWNKVKETAGPDENR